jgi:serine/threonine-protein kinase ULK4
MEEKEADHRVRTGAGMTATAAAAGDDGDPEEVDEMWAWEEEASALVPLRDLLVCAQDTQVKPIIFNRGIEVIEAPTFKASSLPFQPRSAEDVAALPPAELEAFLTQVYKSLASRDLPVADKVHVLAYLYPICKHDAVANIVINSSFATLLLQMIKRFKSSSLRCLLVTLIGVLVS